MENFTKVGNVIAAKGNVGELKFVGKWTPVNDECKDFPFFLRINGALVPYPIEYINYETNVFKIRGINSRNDLDSLIGADIMVNSDLEDLMEKENLATDNGLNKFLGYTVIVVDRPIGLISRIEEFPSQIMMTVNVDGAEKYVPLVEAWIVDSDDSKKTLSMDLPEGLI